MRNVMILFYLLASVTLFAQEFSDQVKNERIESGDEVSWEQFGPGNAGFVNLLRYHPTLPDICFTSPDLFEAYQTENNGKSWKTVKDVDASGDRRLARLYELEYSSSDPAFAITIESSRLHISQDTGRSWQVVHNCPWYDTHGGVTDDSRHWFQKVSSVALDPSDANTWYVGAGNFPRGQQQLAWTSMPNPTAANPLGQDSRYMGTIWKTTNAGQSWTTLTNGIHPQAQFSRIVVHPENSELIFAASQYGLFRSVDGGASWVNIGEGTLDNNTIMNMDYYHDVTSSKFILYVADQVRYYPDGQSTRSDGGIFKSEDNGDSWTNITGNLGLDINRLSGGVPDNYYKYIAKWFGISEASARTTYPVLPTTALQYFNSLNVDPSQENTLYVGFHDAQIQNSIAPGRLWKTSDGGQNWISVARDFGPAWEANQDYWTERGNPTSDNMEMGHEPFTQQFGQNYPLRSLRYCAVNARGDVMILFAHNTLLSTDGGESWQQVDEDYTANGNIMGRGNSNLPGQCIYLDKRLGEGVGYFGSGEHHLWKTTNDGTDGRQAAAYLNGSQESVFSVVTHPWDEDIVFTTSMRQSNLDRIFRSTDGGESFEDWGKATEATEWMRTNHLRIDPVDPNFMYFGVTEVGGSGGGGGTDGPDADKEGGFHKSVNGGRSFTTSNNGLPASPWVRDIEFDPRDDTRSALFIACPWNEEKKINGGLFYSADRGENWTEIPVSNKIEGVNNLQFDPSGRLYVTAGRREAGLDNGGLFYSDDYGQSWTQVFDGPFVDNFAISPFDRNVLVLSMSVLTKNPGIFISQDRGATWAKSNASLGRPAGITQIEFDYHEPTKLWISVFGGGFYRGQFPAGAATRKVTVSPGVAAIALNESLQLVPVVSGDVDKTSLVYQSSNPSIAGVDSEGNVTGLKRGAARIYVSSADGRYTDFVQLTVDTDNLPVSDIRLTPDPLVLIEGETKPLTANISPKEAAGDALTWTSSDSTVATVDKDGSVSALKEGTAEISATSENGVDGTAQVIVNPINRTRFVNFDNRAAFIPTGEVLPEFELGETIDVTISYATGINEAVEEDLVNIATRIRQVDENGAQVAIGPFILHVPETAPNKATTTYSYAIPATFANGVAVPTSDELPAGHKLELRTILVARSATGAQVFANATDEIKLVTPVRDRFVSFDNRGAYIPADGTLPQFEIGETFDVTISYATGITDGFEEDLVNISTRIRQVDENGAQVAVGPFVLQVFENAPNAATTTYTYTIPDAFADGTSVPNSVNLPAGHKLELRTILVAKSATGAQVFANATHEIILATGRERFVNFDNQDAYVPSGGTLPEFKIGETFDVTISYATGIADGFEEDLVNIATRIRQVDQFGSQVAIGPFILHVFENAPNAATTTYSYTIPETFVNGASVPTSSNLPAGHKLELVTVLVAESAVGTQVFADATDEIVLTTGRDRFVRFDNREAYVPDGGTLPEFNIGETFDVTISYATGIADGFEEDLINIATRIRQVDQFGAQVAIGPFILHVFENAPNAATTTYSYTIPDTFANGAPVPSSSNLPAGHKLELRTVMVARSATGTQVFANATDEIILTTGRDRFVNFDNRDAYIPTGGTRPRFEIGETFDVTISYATGIRDDFEEDLVNVATRIRQVDAFGGQVAIGPFILHVFENAPNAATTTYEYTIPDTFANGSPVPTSENLPLGHKLELITVLVAESETGVQVFADATDEIELVIPGRERFVSFDNRDSYVPDGGLLPEFEIGETFEVTISYATGITAGFEEDLVNVATRIRQVNAFGGQVAVGPFILHVFENAPNAATTTYEYTIPDTFANGSLVPTSANLPTGHKLELITILVAESETGTQVFAEATDEIILNDPIVSVTGVDVTPEKIVLEVGASNGLTASITPANATDQSVSWASSDVSVATVDPSGVVTAVGGGQAVITVTTNDGGFTATSLVQVQAPYLGTNPVPGVLEAEDYDLGGSEVAYVDTTPGNSGGAYRTDDVDLVATTDLNGGYHVTAIEAGEWLAYTVDVATTGAYYLSFRVASNTNFGALSMSVDGVNKTGTVNIPNTIGTWQTLAVSMPISLSAGTQALRVNIESGDFDLNYLELVAVPSGCIGVSDWLLGAVYNTGDEVIYNGLRYVAKYYTTSVPGSEAWKLMGYCGAAYPDCYDVSEWRATTTYTRSGTSIRYQGDLYISRWYASAGQIPGVADVWEYVGPCSAASLDTEVSDCPSDVYAWNSGAIYRTAGAYVTHNGHLYVNLWYANAGEEPGVAAVWSLERPCNPIAVAPTCPDVPVWEAKVYATSGTEVVHNNATYTNLWYAQSSDEPGVAAVWNYEGPCTTATARVTSEVAGGLLLDDTSESFHYSLAPNPFSDQLTLRLGNNKQYDRVEMVDLLGRVVLSQSLSMDQAEVELSIGDEKLERGLYLIRLIGEEGVKVLKVRKD